MIDIVFSGYGIIEGEALYISCELLLIVVDGPQQTRAQKTTLLKAIAKRYCLQILPDVAAEKR